MKRVLSAICALILISACATQSKLPIATTIGLTEHFLGSSQICAQPRQPIVINADATVDGEIDDTISLLMYKKLEAMGCVTVIAVGSVRGNGGYDAKTMHANLISRLKAIHAENWSIFRGPTQRMIDGKQLSPDDINQLKIAADAINSSDKPVTIVELGPMTI